VAIDPAPPMSPLCVSYGCSTTLSVAIREACEAEGSVIRIVAYLEVDGSVVISAALYTRFLGANGAELRNECSYRYVDYYVTDLAETV
jgi:hypothetical protein